MRIKEMDLKGHLDLQYEQKVCLTEQWANAAARYNLH